VTPEIDWTFEFRLAVAYRVAERMMYRVDGVRGLPTETDRAEFFEGLGIIRLVVRAHPAYLDDRNIESALGTTLQRVQEELARC
jgi:hypothetical protein